MNRVLLILLIAALLSGATLSSSAARVFMRNAEDCDESCWTDTIEFVIDDEQIAGGVHMTLSGRKEIEPPAELGGFALLWGCVRNDGADPSLEVTYRAEPHGNDTPTPQAANCENYRLLGTWGMYPDHEHTLIPQEIHNREVTFAGDFTCDQNLGEWFDGGYVWMRRPFTYCVPLGITDIFYVRGEARRADEGAGLGQVNFAKICDEGSDHGGPTMQMRTQVKGVSIEGEPVSLDHVPIIISRTSPDFCILVGRGSEAVVLASGYRLDTAGHSMARMASRPPPQNGVQ